MVVRLAREGRGRPDGRRPNTQHFVKNPRQLVIDLSHKPLTFLDPHHGTPAATEKIREGVNAMDAIRFTAKEREFVYGVAMKYMKDEEKAHDVTQDALLLAYRHRGSFRGDSRLTTWLYRIAATTALMHLRKDRRVPQLQSID